MFKELRHENFTRQGFNVIMSLQVDAIKAMKGGTPTFQDPCNNTQEVYIKAGTKTEYINCSRRTRIINPRTKKRGDLHIYTDTILPLLDTQEKLQQFIERLHNE